MCSQVFTGMLIIFSGLFLKNDVICYYLFRNPNYFPCAHLLLLQYSATNSVLRRFPKIAKCDSDWTDFREIRHLSVFRKSVEKIQVSLKPDKNNGYII